MDCMESSSEDFDYSSKQQSALDSIIEDHYPCLSHTKGRKGKVNHWQFKDVDIEQHIDDDHDIRTRSFGISFLDIKDATSMKDNSKSCLHDDSVQLDYNKHCISMVTYEPLLKVSGDGYNWTNYENSGYECLGQNVSQFWFWGLDAIDSTYLDGSYYYPNSSADNGVDLYILDTGVLSTHDEFETGQVTGDEPENSECEANHGTHVAGIAGGQNVGHSRSIPIISYRVCACEICFTSLQIEALADINDKLSQSTRRGVINMSLGGPKTFFAFIDQYYYGEIRNNGGIIVVAAGNDDTDACDQAPAFSTQVITVGSTTWNYTKSWFSNYGDCVDIWAPGSYILSSLATNDTAYGYLSGTSMASPAIAGQVATLLWVNPTLTYQQVYTILQSRTSQIDGNVCSSYYDCQQFLYNCSLFPTEYYSTLIPTSTVAPSIYDGIASFDCNYVAYLSIDTNRTDSSNYKDFFISSIGFEVTDKCISIREEESTGESYEFSYIVRCETNTSVSMWYYGNSSNCSSDGDNEIYGGVIESGLVKGNDWFVVDCSFDNDEDDSSYDSSDCDIVVRDWDSCDYDESSSAYYDQNYLAGACYVSSSGAFQFSYSMDCYNRSDGGIYVIANLYYGTQCNSSLLSNFTSIFASSGCYNGTYTQILECNGLMVDIDTTTTEPITTVMSTTGDEISTTIAGTTDDGTSTTPGDEASTTPGGEASTTPVDEASTTPGDGTSTTGDDSDSDDTDAAMRNEFKYAGIISGIIILVSVRDNVFFY